MHVGPHHLRQQRSSTLLAVQGRPGSIAEGRLAFPYTFNTRSSSFHPRTLECPPLGLLGLLPLLLLLLLLPLLLLAPPCSPPVLTEQRAHAPHGGTSRWRRPSWTRPTQTQAPRRSGCPSWTACAPQCRSAVEGDRSQTLISCMMPTLETLERSLVHLNRGWSRCCVGGAGPRKDAGGTPLPPGRFTPACQGGHCLSAMSAPGGRGSSPSFPLPALGMHAVQGERGAGSKGAARVCAPCAAPHLRELVQRELDGYMQDAHEGGGQAAVQPTHALLSRNPAT